MTEQAPRIPLTPIEKRIILNQMLFTCGHSLTSGAFLSFFGLELGGAGFAIGLLMAVPDLAGWGGYLGSAVLSNRYSKKVIYICSTFISRMLWLLIPSLLLCPQELRSQHVSADIPVSWIFLLLVGIVTLSWAIQYLAFVSYVSWITGLINRAQWDRLLGRWELSRVAILIVLPPLVISLRSLMSKHASAAELHVYYQLIFTVGCLFQLLSILPVIQLPRDQVATSTPLSSASHPISQWNRLTVIFTNRSLLCLILGSWWLAFFQGLTQSVFFLYLIKVLKTSQLFQVSCMSGMYLMQSLLCFTTVYWCQKYGSRQVYFFSLIGVSMALLCWLQASAEQWGWIVLAYLIWGIFAAVNISGQSMLLKHAPADDNRYAFALFRPAAGAFAALSGLFGGWYLDQLLKTNPTISLFSSTLNSYQWIILVSWVGRITASLWILGVAAVPAPEVSSSGLDVTENPLTDPSA